MHYTDQIIKTVEVTPSLINVIRPIRIETGNEFLLDRIANFTLDSSIPLDVSFTIVDEGSDAIYKAKIEEICRSNGLAYISLKNQSELFCPGRARNFGAMLSKSKYIFFQDLDLLPYDGFYQSLKDQISIVNMDKDSDQFCMIPCIYLTESGVDAYDGSILCKNKLIHQTFALDKTNIERSSSGTSACLYNRVRFLQMGGFDENFVAWGYEDLDLNCRFARLSKKFPLSKDWSSDKFNFNSVVEYEGWKAVYRLFGDISFQQGLVLFHAHHPIHKSKLNYRGIVEKNRRYFLSSLKGQNTVHALPDLTKGRSLLIKKCAFTFNESIRPFLGEVFMLDSLGLNDIEKVFRFIEKEKINRVVFLNPYASALTEQIYKRCQLEKKNILICERGALPGSCFYDDCGFLFESNRYHPDHWVTKLTLEQQYKLNEFRASVINSNESLERQGKIVSTSQLKTKYEIQDKKVILVPLQRPNDTAVRKFVRFLSYNEFLQLLSKLSDILSDEYVILVKKHPLEDSRPELEGKRLKFVDQDENINSLIQLSDYILTFTSGVGLLGLLMNKTVMTVGNAFYSQKDICVNVDSAEDILQNLRVCTTNTDKIEQFVYYLIHSFYSFGTFVTKDVRMADNTRMTATVGINLHTLRIDGNNYSTPIKHKALIGFESELFDRYRASWNQARSKIEPKKQEPVSEHSIRKDSTDLTRTQTRTQKRIKKLYENPYRYFSESNWFVLRFISRFFR